jgi:copper chaperone CopZ
LERLPGVKKAEVSLKAHEARVEFDDAKTSPEKLRAAIDRLGFRARVVSVGRVRP